jgi:tetratricopeptide (TPR) repeat protein
VRTAVALCLVIVAGLARVAAAEPNEAERLYTEGQKAYDDQHYDQALVAWERSYALSHLPALIFNIAQAYRLHGDCAKAVASYRKFVELDPSSEERPNAEALIKEMQPCPAPVVAAKPGKPAVVAPVVVGPGHPGRGKRIVGGVLALGGVALVATGAVFGNKASSLADEVKTTCATGCDFATIAAKDADGRSAERNQYIFYGAGAAALVTGGVLYWLGKREHAPVLITPRADGGAAITVGGSW